MARRWKVLAVVSLAVFVVSLDMFIVNLAFPDIRRDFRGVSLGTMSWVLNAYAIVLAALLVPVGRTADRLGRRRGFLLGLVIFTIGSALCGAAPSAATLVLARVVQAAGAAALLPTALALLLPEFTPAQRPAAIGIWAAVGGLAAACGPPLGGLLVQVSWRMVFLVNLPVGVLAFAYGRRLLREARDPAQARPDLVGSLVLIAAIGLLTLGLVKAPDWGWGDARTVAGLALAMAGLAGFWVRCSRHPVPVIEPALLRIRSFAMANTASILFSAAFSAMVIGNVLFMTSVWRYSVLTAGFALMPGPASAAVTAVVGGRLAGRLGPERVALAGIATFALGCGWWLWHLGNAPAYAADMLPGQFITGLGVGLTLPSVASAAAASLPPARFAAGSAVMNMSRQIGFALGVAVFVAVLGRVGPDPASSFRGAWLAMVVIAAVGAAVAAGIGRVEQNSSAESSAPGVVAEVA